MTRGGLPLVALVAALAIACGDAGAQRQAGTENGTPEAAPTAGPATAQSDTPPLRDNLVPVRQIERMPRTMLLSHRYDVDADGAAETVELWVDAERDARGRMMFDDGQRWALFVRDDDRLYALFDGFVQLGHPEFWIYERFNEGPPVIVLLLDQSAGLAVHLFTWDTARGGFTHDRAAAVIGNRVYHSGVPE